MRPDRESENREVKLVHLLEECHACIELNEGNTVVIINRHHLEKCVNDLQQFKQTEARRALQVYSDLLEKIDSPMQADYFGMLVHAKNAPHSGIQPAEAMSAAVRTQTASALKQSSQPKRTSDQVRSEKMRCRKTGQSSADTLTSSVRDYSLFHTLTVIESTGLDGHPQVQEELQNLCAYIEEGDAASGMDRFESKRADFASMIESHGLTPRLMSVLERIIRLRAGE